MRLPILVRTILIAAVFVAGFWAGHQRGSASMQGRVFELRTYTANEGKLQDLLARFRNHTVKLFEKHGMKNVGYWIPQEAPLSQNTLIYVLSHESRDAAQKSWLAFRGDGDWKKAQAASEVNGRLVQKVDALYMNAADFSPMK